MKVVAFNGSPRKNGNTALMIDKVLEPVRQAGIDTEVIQIGGKLLRGCSACMQCVKNKDGMCVLPDDGMNDYIEKMRHADGILLGSPTYFADITAEMKALIDRAGFVGRVSGNLYARKVGAGIVALRRGGGVHAFDTLNNFFLIQQMIVPGSLYWNLGIGREEGESANDAEGMNNMTDLGETMAWLLHKLNA